MLKLARLEPSEAARRDERINLTELVSACVAENLPLAAAKGVDLGLDARLTGTLLRSREELRLLFANLLQNAIRYTGEGGCVDVRASVVDGFATVEIVDTGPGIPEAELPRVFERFYRAGPPGVEGRPRSRDRSQRRWQIWIRIGTGQSDGSRRPARVHAPRHNSAR